MNKDESKEFDSIFAPEASEEQAPRAIYSHRLEITLSPPRTKRFTELSGRMQKVFMTNLLTDVFEQTTYKLKDMTFELSPDGNHHCHCFYDIESSIIDARVMVKVAAMMILEKLHLYGCGVRYTRYNSENFNSTTMRYKQPCVCVQWRDPEDERREKEWSDYIHKMDEEKTQ